MCAIFDFWWNNFLMGMKFNFKFESWENFTKDFHVKKKVLWFCWNLAHIKFTIFKCAQFSSFGETTFLWEWNSILRFGKIFTKDFHVKKNYMGIPCKMNQDQNSMGFFCKVFCWKKERKKKRKERKMKERKERTEGVLYPYLRRPLPKQPRASVVTTEWVSD